MLITLDQADFQKLSPSAQRELAAMFSLSWPTLATRRAGDDDLHWRRPVDIGPEQAVRLIHGLAEDDRRRLQLFSRKSGRVRVSEILKLTGEHDLRATSAFQKEMTRRLRRLIDDPEKKAQLIAWDFEATRWDDKQTTITEGVYYVSRATAEALAAAFKGSRGD